MQYGAFGRHTLKIMEVGEGAGESCHSEDQGHPCHSPKINGLPKVDQDGQATDREPWMVSV